jgi:hypothetical protein
MACSLLGQRFPEHEAEGFLPCGRLEITLTPKGILFGAMVFAVDEFERAAWRSGWAFPAFVLGHPALDVSREADVEEAILQATQNVNGIWKLMVHIHRKN